MVLTWFNEQQCQGAPIALPPSDTVNGCSKAQCCDFMFEHEEHGVWFQTQVYIDGVKYQTYGSEVGEAYCDDGGTSCLPLSNIVIGAIIGCTVAIALLAAVIIVYCCCRKRTVVYAPIN
jgi:hypothetical protein